jgi:hypothetical protein
MAGDLWSALTDPNAWYAMGNRAYEALDNDEAWKHATGYDPADTNMDGELSPGEKAIQNAKNLGQWNDGWDQIVNPNGVNSGSSGSGSSPLPQRPQVPYQQPQLFPYRDSGGYEDPFAAMNRMNMQGSMEASRLQNAAQIAAGQNATQAGIANSRNANDMNQLLKNLEFQKQKLAADQAMMQQKMQMEREIAAGNNLAQLQAADKSANASMYPHTLANSRWNQVFPMFNSLMNGGDVGGAGGGSGGGNWWTGATSSGTGSSAGGSGYTPVGTQPKIDAGPIWSAPQIQQQVNAQIAANNARTAGQNRRISQDLGSRGFGSRSPLSMALMNQGNMANMAANAASDRGIRWDAAQGNATHLLNSQKAQESQFASRQAEQLENQKNQLGYKGSLINALMGGWK